MPLFGCLCYTMWAMPLCNACLFCIRSMLAGNKQPGSWSCFACHSHETIGDAFLPRQQSTGSAQRRGSPLTVGLPYIFCHTSYRNLASFASFPASCHCMFRAGRVYAGRAGCGSLMPVPHCMFSAGRCVFWCPLAGAESDFCGRNGRWKGLIFRHNRVFVQNQEAVLKKVAFVGCTQAIFRLGRVKTSVDQSAALIPAG